MKQINLLHLITGLGMGGAERVVLDLAKHRDKGVFNTFVVSLSQRVEMLEEFQKNKINITALQKDNSIKSLIQIILFLNDYVKQNQIDIIHAHMTHSIIIASIIKILNPKIKIVYTSHNLNIGSKKRELIIWSLKLFRNIDIVFSKDILKFFYKKDYVIIPNGINIKKYQLNEKKYDKFTFIAIGRLEIMKNHKFLIEIVNKLKKYDFQLLIVGEGHLRKELENLIYQYKLENKVKLLGLRNDIPKLLNKSHCFVMPSLWEGLPIVLLEAGASKLPVIITPVGSIPNVIDEEKGYLSELDKFESNMINVMQNYLEATAKGQKLFDTINAKFSINIVVKEHEKIYKKLLK